jgi:hypothetical protein
MSVKEGKGVQMGVPRRDLINSRPNARYFLPLKPEKLRELLRKGKEAIE